MEHSSDVVMHLPPALSSSSRLRSACPAGVSRREMLRLGAAGAAFLAASPLTRVMASERNAIQAASAPSLPVAIERCRSYEPAELSAKLNKALDSIGGIQGLMSDKTVTIKLNLTGDPRQTLGGWPSYRTYQVHPHFVAAVCAAIHGAGARKIVLVESSYDLRPLDEEMAAAGWDIDMINQAGGGTVSWEDTRNRGPWRGYSRLAVPGGGYLYDAFDVNSRYEETDVFVSLAKLKEHITAGVTMSVKNLFGIAPSSIYGSNYDPAGNPTVFEQSTTNRSDTFHDGRRRPPNGAPQEIDPNPPRRAVDRVPRIVADLFLARPVDLCLVDGIETNRGGEGPWCQGASPLQPRLLLAGRNGVCTDAVCVTVMGFDPEATAGERPFPGENHLALLAGKGIGTNRIEEIETIGTPLEDAIFPFDRLRIQRSGDRCELTWGNGSLQGSDGMDGDWVSIPNANSPYRVTPTGKTKFYRLSPD